MKSFIKRNLLSIILAGVIILMIPAVIILPKKLNKENDLAGTYRRYGEVNDSYIDYTAVVEKMSDGRYMVTYKEDSNVNHRRGKDFKFVIPSDYEYGTLIEIKGTDSYIKTVKVDVQPGCIFITGYIGYTEYDFAGVDEVLRKENYEMHNPIVETLLESILILLCVGLVASIVVRFKFIVGLGATVLGTFLAVAISVDRKESINYEGYYTLDKVPDVVSQNRYVAFYDIYLRKAGDNSYNMYTCMVGDSFTTSDYFDYYQSELRNLYVKYEDNRIVVEKKHSIDIGVPRDADVYFEKKEDKYVVYRTEDDIIFEYRQVFGRKEYNNVFDFVRILGVLMLFAVTLKKYIEYLKREKPDVFEQFYGVYDVSELICAGEEYSDFAAYAAQGIVGSIIKVAKDTFSIKDSDYNEVRYEFQKNIELLKGMYPEFENAQTVSVDVEENRYYLVHGKQKNAIITTMGGRMFIACEIRKNAEYQQEGLI